MSESGTYESIRPLSFIMGVLDHRLFTGPLSQSAERARRPSSASEAIATLKTVVAAVEDKARRQVAVDQLERIEVALASGRWNRLAAGHLLEAVAADEVTTLDDHTALFHQCSSFIYGWNEDFAEQIYTFFTYVSDRTVPWATSSEVWRAAVMPDEVLRIQDAISALTPREFKRIMVEADQGEVFSEAEAELLAEWWTQVRRVLRLAARLEQGVMFAARYGT